MSQWLRLWGPAAARGGRRERSAPRSGVSGPERPLRAGVGLHPPGPPLRSGAGGVLTRPPPSSQRLLPAPPRGLGLWSRTHRSAAVTTGQRPREKLGGNTVTSIVSSQTRAPAPKSRREGSRVRESAPTQPAVRAAARNHREVVRTEGIAASATGLRPARLLPGEHGPVLRGRAGPVRSAPLAAQLTPSPSQLGDPRASSWPPREGRGDPALTAGGGRASARGLLPPRTETPPAPSPVSETVPAPGKALLAAKLAEVAAASSRVHVGLKEKERNCNPQPFLSTVHVLRACVVGEVRGFGLPRVQALGLSPGPRVCRALSCAPPGTPAQSRNPSPDTTRRSDSPG
ncbi:uncharacterized protein [Vicugna pacos]|uniref:Uncharacterized protein n=1 Tax=Vicugna pacos TaxID=30538 RepID=A0ABM5BDA2_VICPA